MYTNRAVRAKFWLYSLPNTNYTGVSVISFLVIKIFSKIRFLFQNLCQGVVSNGLTNIGSSDVSTGIKIDPDEFPKSGAVVILHSFGVSESFKNWISFKKLLL